jgi:hypothetical protein
MKFPCGICDFQRIITQDMYSCDRTGYMSLLEQGVYQLFVRPRRFGKSLLLSTLANYYNVAKAEVFQSLFWRIGHTSRKRLGLIKRTRWMRSSSMSAATRACQKTPFPNRRR